MKNAFIALAWIYALQASSAEPSPESFPDDMAILIAHRGKTNLVKRATVVHDGAHYHLFSGFMGSGLITYTAFIYRETPEGLVLAYFYPEYRNPVGGVGIIPEITDKSVVLTFASRNGPVKLDEVSFDNLKKSSGVRASFSSQ